MEKKLKQKFNKLKEHKIFDTFIWFAIKGILVGIGFLGTIILTGLLLAELIKNYTDVMMVILGGIFFIGAGIAIIGLTCLALAVLLAIGIVVMSWFGVDFKL
jgi:hypothetical protein